MAKSHKGWNTADETKLNLCDVLKTSKENSGALGLPEKKKKKNGLTLVLQSYKRDSVSLRMNQL